MAVVYAEVPTVYADGRKMIVSYCGSGSLVLNAPFIKSVSMEMERPRMDVSFLGSHQRYMPGDIQPSGELTLTLGLQGMEYRTEGVPDLSAFVDSLTVSQLFAAINRKLDKRES